MIHTVARVAVPVAIGLWLVTAVGSSSIHAEEDAPSCSEADALDALYADPPPEGCQYRMYQDDETVTFHADDYILAGVYWFIWVAGGNAPPTGDAARARAADSGKSGMWLHGKF